MSILAIEAMLVACVRERDTETATQRESHQLQQQACLASADAPAMFLQRQRSLHVIGESMTASRQMCGAAASSCTCCCSIGELPLQALHAESRLSSPAFIHAIARGLVSCCQRPAWYSIHDTTMNTDDQCIAHDLMMMIMR